MSLFKKPKRKFRQRETRSDSEDESSSIEIIESKPKPLAIDSRSIAVDNQNRASSASFTVKDDKSEPTVPKVTKLLSFHDEEEDTEVFKLKKSNYSRRLAKQRERERKKREEALEPGIAERQGPRVSKSTALPAKKEDRNTHGNIFAGNEAEDMEMDSEEESEKPNPFKNVLQSGVIPDAATIYAMKKHRQMAREMGDFIPVEEEKDEDDKSRLIRDDDNDRSDDDEDHRINFTINTGAVERQKIRETFLSLQEDATNNLENEDAIELELWEREQIKKGVGVTQVGPLESSRMSEQMYAYPQSNVTSYMGETNGAVHSNPVQQMPVDLLNSKETNLTTSDIKARLQERLNALKTVHRVHEQEYDNLDKELFEAEELVKKLEIETPMREDNYALFQQMSGYVRDFVDCMDVKVAHIDLLDGRMINLYKERNKRLAARRQLDIRDQSEEFSAIAAEILKGMNAEFVSEKAANMNENKLRRAAEREGRRMRRRKLRDRKGMTSSLKHIDGMSSDDEELDSDVMEFKASRENILREATTIFEDVVEDFGTLKGVATCFERWKLIQMASYTEAYVPLCLPKIFGVFVKLDLLDWNPLEEERDFEKSFWFRQLLQYSSVSFSEENEDPDVNLLPGIIEKIVLPKVTLYVQSVWNPTSQRETSNLVSLIKKLLEDYPSINGKSKQFQAFLKAVTTSIDEALKEEVFIPLYPKELLENRSLGAYDFSQRQFWSATKLLQNILAWEGLIAEQPLQQIALGSLLNRYLLMSLNTSVLMRDTLEKCKTIVTSLPKNWLRSTKDGGSTLLLLKRFSGFLINFAESIHSVCLKKSMPSEEGKEVIREILQLLVAVESSDDAVRLAKKYSISGVKSS